jgi:DNA-binding transcriptional LysR family regulator
MHYFFPDGLLEAFVMVAETGSISAAAKRLHVTQPALTIRLKKLEEHTGARVFVRGQKGVSLTKQGELLLKYARSRAALDTEFKEIASGSEKQELAGVVRIASHFSVIYCSILPCLAPLLKAEPKLQVQLIVKEDDEIPALLVDGKCDLALLQRPLGNPEYQAELVGWERYVLAESKIAPTRESTILATDPSDDFADLFFGIQASDKRKATWSRSYLFNEMGILRGVELGLGRSIVFEPLVKSSTLARVAPGYKPLDIPVYLHAHSLSLHSLAVRKTFAYISEKRRRFFRQSSGSSTTREGSNARKTG